MEKQLPKRAARGRLIVHAESRYRDSNDNLADVLEDLMMYALWQGVDFEKELAVARKFFLEDGEKGKE